MGVLLGSTIGAIFWVPGLIATLVCFGIPLAWGQRLAAKGLAGEERGELLVGAVSALVGILGVLIAAVAPPPHFFDTSEAWGLSAVRVLIEAVGAVAALAGGAARCGAARTGLPVATRWVCTATARGPLPPTVISSNHTVSPSRGLPSPR